MIRTLLQALFGWFFAMFERKPRQLTSGDLPVEFISKIEGLRLRIDRATMMARIEPVLHLVGVLENRGTSVVHELSFEIEGFSGEISVGSHYEEVLAGHHASLEPGDCHAFDLKVPLKGDVQQVVVKAVDFNAGPAKPYVAGPEAPIDWGVPPDGFDVVIRERKHETHRFGDGRFSYCHVGLEVTNVGKDIEVLKLQLWFKDAYETTYDEREALVAWAGGPKLKHGERRLVHVISKVPSSYKVYSGRVVEVR